MTTELTRRLVVFTCFLVTAVTLIPVVMMVLVAFQSDAESMAASPSFWPSSWHPENLERAFDLCRRASVPLSFRSISREQPATSVDTMAASRS